MTRCSSSNEARAVYSALLCSMPQFPGELQIPHEALYKKHVLLMRGRFNPFTMLHNDMLVNAAQHFFCSPEQGLAPGGAVPRVTDSLDECVYRKDTLVLLEISTNDMLDAGDMLDWCVATTMMRICCYHFVLIGHPTP